MTTLAELPIWTLLTRPSLEALLSRDGSMPEAIKIAADLHDVSVADAPLLALTRLMIQRAQALDGLTLTATGALSRIDVRAFFDEMTWPGYDKANVLVMNKALNEADVMPVEITRRIAQDLKLLRKRERRLLASKAGTMLVRENQAAALFRQLFATTFWEINLAYFDRVPLEAWPQNHIGIVLWCLSVAGHEWFKAEDLIRTCTVWDDTLDEGPLDFAGFAFESRVLRPLTWFGLMETRLEGEDDVPDWRRARQYRKTALFDRALRFEVQMNNPSGVSH
ncbi:hypothetical protein [Methylobacterium frigidaeris]|nr:hypothetical protein [Methylobacterium frigidaeris]